MGGGSWQTINECEIEEREYVCVKEDKRKIEKEKERERERCRENERGRGGANVRETETTMHLRHPVSINVYKPTQSQRPPSHKITVCITCD